jgi:hypothetical protein
MTEEWRQMMPVVVVLEVVACLGEVEANGMLSQLTEW